MIVLLPFVLQAVLMAIDEFYCHRRRTLGRWERIGHPVDTFSFIASLGWLLIAAPSEGHLWVYGALATVSCLCITKDEWQHRQHSDAFENWIHALLFILHPVLLIFAGWLWWNGNPGAIAIASGSSFLFMIYQILYWNFAAEITGETRGRSGTPSKSRPLHSTSEAGRTQY